MKRFIPKGRYGAAPHQSPAGCSHGRLLQAHPRGREGGHPSVSAPLPLHVWHVFLRRPMSLSTIAILNSVKKAVESKSRHHSRSTGVLSLSLSPERLDKVCHRGKSQVPPSGPRELMEVLGLVPQTQGGDRLKHRTSLPLTPFQMICFLIFKTNNFGDLGFWVAKQCVLTIRDSEKSVCLALLTRW